MDRFLLDIFSRPCFLFLNSFPFPSPCLELVWRGIYSCSTSPLLFFTNPYPLLGLDDLFCFLSLPFRFNYLAATLFPCSCICLCLFMDENAVVLSGSRMTYFLFRCFAKNLNNLFFVGGSCNWVLVDGKVVIGLAEN
ncbi:hypothetical protein VPH35_115179 [Triticum aestivum]